MCHQAGLLWRSHVRHRHRTPLTTRIKSPSCKLLMAVPLHAGAITSISLVITVHKRARTQSLYTSLGVCGGQHWDKYWQDTHECDSKQKRSLTVVVSPGAAEAFIRSGLLPESSQHVTDGPRRRRRGRCVRTRPQSASLCSTLQAHCTVSCPRRATPWPRDPPCGSPRCVTDIGGSTTWGAVKRVTPTWNVIYRSLVRISSQSVTFSRVTAALNETNTRDFGLSWAFHWFSCTFESAGLSLKSAQWAVTHVLVAPPGQVWRANDSQWGHKDLGSTGSALNSTFYNFSVIIMSVKLLRSRTGLANRCHVSFFQPWMIGCCWFPPQTQVYNFYLWNIKTTSKSHCLTSSTQTSTSQTHRHVFWIIVQIPRRPNNHTINVRYILINEAEACQESSLHVIVRLDYMLQTNNENYFKERSLGNVDTDEVLWWQHADDNYPPEPAVISWLDLQGSGAYK